MSPPIPGARLLPSYEPGQRIRVHTLNFLAGMMPRGSVRKNHVVHNVEAANGIWSAKCVQWSSRAPIWEILAANPYSPNHA